MRRFLAFATIVALTACGGGGGSNSAPVTAPTTPPGTPSGNLVTPTFTLRIPAPTGSAAKRSPKFVSSHALSVKITLNSDSAGINPASLAGNPAITNVNGTSGLSCTAGCTVNGPPSPVGNDNFTVTLFDNTNATGSALDTATQTFPIAAGVANSSSITLNGIPAAIAISGVPAANAFAAGTASSSTLTVTVTDADGQTITGTYANPVTVADPDTLSDGSSVAATTCPAQGAETTIAASSVMLTADTSSAKFCYNGIAEGDVTLTSSATGVTGGTAIFQPQLAAPAFVVGSGTPVGVVNGSEIDLFAPSGAGSTGSVNFTETGWTGAPFSQLLSATAGTCSSGGPLSTFATLATAASGGGATTITATAASPETPGLCAVTVSDGITTANNPTDGSGTFNVSYTTTTIPVNGHARKTH